MMLAVLGTDLAFSGKWDVGTAMAEKAVHLMGTNASFIWWYAPAKRHWLRGEYQEPTKRSATPMLRISG